MKDYKFRAVSLCNNKMLIKVAVCLYIGSSQFTFAGPKTEQNSPVTEAPARPKSNEKISVQGQALDLFRKKKYDECSKLLWKNIDSLNREGLNLLARVHLTKKEYAETIRIAQMILAKNDKDAEAHTLMGNAQFHLNKEKEALASYKSATEVDSAYQPAYEGLIAVYEKRENLYELRIIYQDMIDKLGEKLEFLTKICDINTKDALNDAAIKYCQRAIAKNDSIPENHVNLGLVYKNQGEDAKALAQLKKTAERFPKSTFAQISYADYAQSKSNYIDSYKYYSACLKLVPENDSCLIGVGLSGVEIQKMDESYSTLKKACFKDRKHAVSVRKVVQSLRTSKKLDWAQKFEALSENCMMQ